MKALVVTDTYYPKIDGVVTSVMNTTRYLANKGHKIIILAPHYDNPYKEKRHANIQIYRFRSFSFPSYKECMVALPDIRRIISIFKRFKPDLVHVHTPGPLGLLSIVLAKREGVPIINTYHTSIPDVILYFSPVKLFKLDDNITTLLELNITKGPAWMEIEKNFKGMKRRVARFTNRNSKRKKKKEPLSRRAIWAISKRLYTPSDLIIAPSRQIKKELARHGVDKEITVISNGIELDLFKKKNRYAKCPRFLHVGRLGFEKNIDVVLNAMREVVKKHPEAVLSIVGDGPARKSLEIQARRFNLGRNIHFFGFIPRDQLPQIYRQHDVFVTASEMETQGIVLMEAMASGLPVIGVNVLAIPEAVHDGRTGFLVPRKNATEMARHMIFFIEHPDLVKEMGKHARDEAEKHDIRLTLKLMEETYIRTCSRLNF